MNTGTMAALCTSVLVFSSTLPALSEIHDFDILSPAQNGSVILWRPNTLRWNKKTAHFIAKNSKIGAPFMVEINCQPKPQIRVEVGNNWDPWTTIRPNSTANEMQKKICSTNSRAIVKSPLTWRMFQSSIKKRKSSSLRSLVPMQLPSEFANGQFAISALHTGRTAYVVAKDGRKLPNLSTASQQHKGLDISFNAGVEADLVSIPALRSFPVQLYNSGQLIEVSRYAARHDDEETRSRMRQSRRATLSNGQIAYYLTQFTQNGDVKGWCSLEDESARYSPFICVNRVGSVDSTLKILESIVVKPISSAK
jgi:hypothetical protein